MRVPRIRRCQEYILWEWWSDAETGQAENDMIVETASISQA
jgi:hypothetical protein